MSLSVEAKREIILRPLRVAQALHAKGGMSDAALKAASLVAYQFLVREGIPPVEATHGR